MDPEILSCKRKGKKYVAIKDNTGSWKLYGIKKNNCVHTSHCKEVHSLFDYQTSEIDTDLEKTVKYYLKLRQDFLEKHQQNK